MDTMGKVHNPSGQGVKAVSSQVKNKTLKASSSKAAEDTAHETKVKAVGSSRRNITRKKSNGADTGKYDSRTKKQGGAGKGKWLELQDGSQHDDSAALDKDDPLYDEADEEQYILSSSGGDVAIGYDEVVEKQVYGPMLTLPEFKLQVADIIREYFDSADSDEVIRSIDEKKCPTYLPQVVKKAISLSLDEGPRERELVSRLLTCLHPTPLSDDDMAAGFTILLESLDDLCIDCPDAKSMVGSFLARAVVDEVLPPAFLSDLNNDNPGNPVVERAVSLLSREHCTARLEKIWGPGDGRPVAELKKVMDDLLQEYLLSRELDEAAQCVVELKAAHFHHELVKRGVRIAMEQDVTGRENLDAMVALFSFLVKNAILSEYQVAKGLARLKKTLDDLTLDIPTASDMLQEFEVMARESDCLPKSVAVVE